MSRSKSKGTRFESDVVQYLRDNGYPDAERRALSGILDRGDIVGVPEWALEVKCVDKMTLGVWASEVEVEVVNAQALYGVIVHKRKYSSTAEAFATMPLRTWVHLVHGPVPDAPTRLVPSTAGFVVQVAAYLANAFPECASDATLTANSGKIAGAGTWVVAAHSSNSLDLRQWCVAAGATAGPERPWVVVHSRRLHVICEAYATTSLAHWVALLHNKPRAAGHSDDAIATSRPAA